MVAKTKRKSRKPAKEVKPEEVIDVCPKCGNRGFIEYNGGLLQVRCDCPIGQSLGGGRYPYPMQPELTEESETHEVSTEGNE